MANRQDLPQAGGIQEQELPLGYFAGVRIRGQRPSISAGRLEWTW